MQLNLTYNPVFVSSLILQEMSLTGSEHTHMTTLLTHEESQLVTAADCFLIK